MSKIIQILEEHYERRLDPYLSPREIKELNQATADSLLATLRSTQGLEDVRQSIAADVRAAMVAKIVESAVSRIDLGVLTDDAIAELGVAIDDL